MASLPLLELSCAVQNYAWGKHGSASEVAQLKSKDSSFLLNEQEPYAEVNTASIVYKYNCFCAVAVDGDSCQRSIHNIFSSFPKWGTSFKMDQ